MKVDEMSKRMITNSPAMIKMMCVSDKIDNLMDADMEVYNSVMKRMMIRLEQNEVTREAVCSKIAGAKRE